MKRVFWIAGIFIIICTSSAYANPTKSGSTGLVKAPTAETLDSGNICVGVWCDASANKTKNPLILPISLTMGIGTFWEIYGSYPNVLFNNQEEASGDGTVQLGMKFRLGLKRNAPSQFAIDTFFRRHLSLDSNIDGVSDFGGRLIYSLHDEQFGAHIYSGYIRNGQPDATPNTPAVAAENEVLFGGGLEYMLNQRSKVTLEATGNTSRADGSEIQLEGLVGYQYYLSPHLTFNLAAGRGLIDSVTDWRVIVGFSTCQGIGTYIKPVPQLVKEREAKKTEVARPTKVIPLSPLMVKSPTPQAVSKLEVPIDPDQEEVIIKPFGQVAVTAQLATAPVVLPRNINLELPGTPAEKGMVEPPATAASGIESKAMEYTLARMSGSTPLYGVIYQEDKLTTESVTALSPPEAMTVYRKFRFPDVIFEVGSITLSKEVVKSLSEVAEIVRKDNRWRYLRIDGHTDNIGSAKYNMELSLRRAIAVANHLISREGLDPAKVFVKGLGKSKPIADNDTAEGRAQNRRFEILFLVNK